MTNELDEAVIVDFPLRGEGWVAVNTPGDRIPSHGTDMLGQRFAYDLLKVDARGPGLRYHPAGASPRAVHRRTDPRLLRLGSGDPRTVRR